MSDSPSSVGGIWKAVILRSVAQRSLLLNLLIVAGFGVLVPWKWGFDFFSPMIIVAYTAVALLIAASTAADVLAASSFDAPFDAAIFVGAFHSVFLLTLIYGLGIVFVNLAIGAPRFLHPNWKLTGAALLFAFCGSLCIAAFAATLVLLFSPTVARNTIRVIFLAILLGVMFGKSRLPADLQFAIDRRLTTPGLTSMALTGSAIALVLAAGIIFAFKKRPT